MEEQVTPTEPVTTAPNPVVADIPTVEPPQTESPQPQAEPEVVAETPQTEPLSEPLSAASETPTPQLPVDEALPETTPEPVPQGAGAVAEGPQGSLPFSKTDDRQENLVAPKVEIPKPSSTPISGANPSEGPPKIQQGTTQSEPTQQQEPSASHPESLPAQAKTIATPPRNILMQLLTKAHLVTQLRKQKKLLKVMGLFAKKKSITNDDVEKLLHVSDATALRYLTHLKKENKIVQVGKTGHAVSYTKI